MSNRLFIVIPISKEIRTQAAKFQQKYRDLDVRWLSGRNLHITLIPPWHETDIEKAKKALDKLKDTIKPFDIEFHKVTFGPNQRNPRLIWAEGPVPDWKQKVDTIVLMQSHLTRTHAEYKTLHKVKI